MSEFLNIDCMEYMKTVPDKYYELCIVDPPYGLERFKNGIGKNDIHKVKTTNANWNNSIPDDIYFNELFRISKNQIIFGANNFNLPPSEYFLCWDKEQAMPNFAILEYAWVSMGLKKPAKLFRYSIHKHNQIDKIHPTQKPVALYRWLLQNYAKKGDKIFDSHVGSGSSLIACIEEGFEYVGCELDKDYYEAASKRIRTHLEQGRLFTA